ncbi:MAG TPA: lasso peptide biosynthesis B2 protein [Polyangiaceae bacterium]|nr:lasso peptide biosynthesis B2 protein [Polyangiaceae bacterium]
MVPSDSEIIAYNLGIAAELRRIVKALGAAGIPCIVLKGVPLVQRIAAGLARHAIVDNDILVRRAHVRRAKVVLEGLGYASLSWRSLEHDLEHGFEHPLSRGDVDGRPLFCELHWNAFPPPLFHVGEETLWKHAVDVEVFDVRMRVFEPTLQLLHLASHVVQHELCDPRTVEVFGRAWSRWSDEIDPTDLKQLAKDIGIAYVLEYLIDATRTLGVTCGPRLVAATSTRVATATRLLPPTRLREAAEDKYPERYFRALVVLMLVSPPRAVAQLLTRAIPPPEHLVRKRGWRAVALHYAVRPWRPIARSARITPRVRALLAATTYVRVFRSLATRYERLPLDRLLHHLETMPRPPQPLTLAELARAVRLAERVAPRLSSTPNTCLFRALARYALLSSHAHRATFVLGVAARPEEPGHAWVEVSGEPFLEPGDPAGFSRILTREQLRDKV